MTNVKKLKDALENFNYAGQALSTIWEGVKPGSIEEKAFDFVSEKYPFQECFNDVSYAIHNWCEDLSEQLTHEQIEEFCKTKKYAMALKGCQEDDNWFEEGWFFSIRNCDNFGEVKICEEIEGGGYNISWEFFKENFVVIPETLANLYFDETAKGSYEALCKIQELAKIMGEKVE